MCGIYGYVGEPTDVGSDILRALRQLEYRGYDSWGVAVGVAGQIVVAKRTGRIANAIVSFPRSGLGFGHTRWATHGNVTIANAHPHLDCTETIAVIHNGIVENERALRAHLVSRGHQLRSETDSEIIAHLLEDELARADANTATALAAVFDKIAGLNAVIALDARRQELIAAKTTSPLAIGRDERGFTIASDAIALNGHADHMFYLEDGQVAQIRQGMLTLYERHAMTSLQPRWAPLIASSHAFDRGAYSHFMLKEIAEQPAVVEALTERATEEIDRLARAVDQASSVIVTGCGSASYAALTGSYLLGQIAGRHAQFVAGSEFRHCRRLLTGDTLVIALSQSGETADIIDAMLTARQNGARLAAIVNVEGSTLDRMVNLAVHLDAGPEQCVLATKSYTAKVAALLLMSFAIAGQREAGVALVRRAGAGMRQLLDSRARAQIRHLAGRIAAGDHLFVLGRGVAYPTALEAALKIKEASYVHAEGFAGGELKHGVIALIEPGTPCLIFAPNDDTRTDMIAGATELRSRGGYIIGVGPAPDPVFDEHVVTPDVGDAAPLVNAVPAQLLGYYAALARGHDPDRPRNLAKSVTVK